jgi:hypothetical protein
VELKICSLSAVQFYVGLECVNRDYKQKVLRYMIV